MRVTFKAKVTAMAPDDLSALKHKAGLNDPGMVTIDLGSSRGRACIAHAGVEPKIDPGAREAVVTALLSIKPVIAETLHYGQSVWITIDTDEPVREGN